MELEVLKKKLSSFRTEGGRLKNVSDEVLIEALKAWEEWQGPASKFYSSIGASYRQFAKLLGKAKKLKREGYGVGTSGFEEILAEVGNPQELSGSPSPYHIELVWDGGRIIRFGKVDSLVDFLKKVA